MAQEKGYFDLDILRIVPLNLNSYTTTFNLDFLSVVMNVGYNERLDKRWISLTTTNGTVLLERTFLDVGRRVDLNINSQLLGLNYYVTLELIDNYRTEVDFYNWKSQMFIAFVGNRTEVKDTIYKTYREQAVGN
jgi:hypothetical protein